MHKSSSIALAPAVTVNSSPVTPSNVAPPPLLLPRREVMTVIGKVDKSTLWRWEHNGLFPLRIYLGNDKKTVRWRADEIYSYAADPEKWVRKNLETRAGILDQEIIK